MSNAIARVESQDVAVWTQAQKDLIKRTVAHEATDDELSMFLHVAARSGLDPLQKQIYFSKRNGRVLITAGIDGLQARAARHEDFEGILYGVVCAKDVFEVDAANGVVKSHTVNPFADRGQVLGAWAVVKRKGKLPYIATPKFVEYNQSNSPTWKQLPYVMIAKVAKSTALRLAYPEDFGGIYEPAEMDQAEREVNHLPAALPAASVQQTVQTQRQSQTEKAKAKLKEKAAIVKEKVGFAVVDVKPGETEEQALERSKAPTVWFGAHKGKPISGLKDNELSACIDEASQKLESDPKASWAEALSTNLNALESEAEARMRNMQPHSEQDQSAAV